MWGKLRRERDPKGKRPKNLPQEDSEWGVYLGIDAYPSVKARERKCTVWLWFTYPHTFYLIVENSWIVIIIEIKICGLVNSDGMFLLCSLEI